MRTVAGGRLEAGWAGCLKSQYTGAPWARLQPLPLGQKSTNELSFHVLLASDILESPVSEPRGGWSGLGAHVV